MELIDKSLSEPYSVFTYRYFLQQWPNLCYLALDGDKAVGVIVCKMDDHRGHLRGYIAMLVVDNTYRGKGLGKQHLGHCGWVPSKLCSSSNCTKARAGNQSSRSHEALCPHELHSALRSLACQCCVAMSSHHGVVALVDC